MPLLKKDLVGVEFGVSLVRARTSLHPWAFPYLCTRWGLLLSLPFSPLCPAPPHPLLAL